MKAAGSTGVTVWVPSRTCQVTLSPSATAVTVPLAGVKHGGPHVLSHLPASPVTLMSWPAAPTTSAHASPAPANMPTTTSTRITDRRTDTPPRLGRSPTSTLPLATSATNPAAVSVSTDGP